MCNHVKLEICSFVLNFNSGGGFSLRVQCCVVDACYGLGRRGLNVQAESLRLERGAGRRERADGGRHARRVGSP